MANNGKGNDDSLFNKWVKPYRAGKDIEKAIDTDAANLKVISELMGHKGIVVTQRYLKVRDEDKKAAVESISIGGAK